MIPNYHIFGFEFYTKDSYHKSGGWGGMSETVASWARGEDICGDEN